jgi:hypothetical protein
MGDKFSSLSSAEKALRGIVAARSGAKKAPKPKRIVPKSAAELQIQPEPKAKVVANEGVQPHLSDVLDESRQFSQDGDNVRALREALHTAEGKKYFLSLKKGQQEGVVEAAMGVNRQWAEDFRAVQAGGAETPVASIADADAPITQVGQLGRDDPQFGDAGPEQPSEGRRQAGPRAKTTVVDAEGNKSVRIDNTPTLETRTGLDRLDDGRDGVPYDIMQGLKEAGLVASKEHPGVDLDTFLNHALSRSHSIYQDLDDAGKAAFAGDPLAHGGLFTDEELTILKHLDGLDPADAKKNFLNNVTQRSEIAHRVAERLRGLRDDKSLDDVRTMGEQWQDRSQLYRDGQGTNASGNKLRSIRRGFNMEPFDESTAGMVHRMALGLGSPVTRGADTTAIGKSGDVEVVDGSEVTSSKSTSKRSDGNTETLLRMTERGHFPVVHHVFTSDDADGFLQNPEKAFNAAIQASSRMQEGKDWQSVQSAVARAETLINSYRNSQGLPNVQWPNRTVKYFHDLMDKEEALAGGVSRTSTDAKSRDAWRKATSKVLAGALKGTEASAANRPISWPPQSSAQPGSNAVAKTETDPAGPVSEGTSRSKDAVPPLAENVRSWDEKSKIPAQRDLDTGELVTTEMSPETAARHEKWAAWFAREMNPATRTGVDFDASLKADAPVATEAPADGSLATPPVVLPVKKSRSRKKPVAETPAPVAETPAPAAEAPAPAAPQPTKAAVESLPPLPKEEAPAAVASGDSEITAYIKKKGRDAAVTQFGEEAVIADGKLVGNQWVPNAAPAPKSIDMTSPASRFETAQKESLEVAKQTQEHAAARAAASEAAAKPVEPAAKPATAAATPAPRTLPADAPPAEQMRNLAEQWGVPYEGVSDLDLFDALKKKSEELRKTHGEEPFSSGEVPPFTKRKMRNGPGDVAEGANQPGELPSVPPELQQSVGELTAEVREPAPQEPGPAVLMPGTGRMPSTSSSTLEKPAPKGRVTSSSGKPRVVDGAKESAPVPPPVPPASTTHIPNLPSHRVKSSETKPKYEEEADWLKPYVDEDGNTARLPAADEAVVPFDGDFPEPKAKKPTRGNLAVGAGLAAVGGAAAAGLGGAAVEHWGPVQSPAPVDAGWPDALDDKPAPRPAPPAKAPQGAAAPPQPAEEPTNDFPEFDDALSEVPAQPQPAAPVAAQAINPASGDAPMSADEVQRLSRALQSVSAARMYGYGQYGPAY